ncbi:MAG TPA: flippase-like domain-containing protein, partial [Anaerolinea sp.]|nr:flippase-like domain-containing protein [Anaerolinea sp.]
HPRLVIRPILHALANKILLIVILTLMFLAFGVEFNMATVIAGFSLAYLFLIVSPTPAGIGIVEGVLTGALGSMQVPIPAAAVITLAYRGITFWMPVLLGMAAFRSLHRPAGSSTNS